MAFTKVLPSSCSRAILPPACYLRYLTPTAACLPRASPACSRPARVGRKRRKNPGSYTDKPDDWRTGNELAGEFYACDKAINTRLRRLKKDLVGDVVQALGCDEEQAEAWVDDHLVGMRR